MQLSKVKINFIRIIELKIEIKRKINENVLDLYVECGKKPTLWKKNFMKIVNNKLQRFFQNCTVKHFFTF